MPSSLTAVDAVRRHAVCECVLDSRLERRTPTFLVGQPTAVLIILDSGFWTGKNVNLNVYVMLLTSHMRTSHVIGNM
jgi:hypothetical protein